MKKPKSPNGARLYGVFILALAVASFPACTISKNPKPTEKNLVESENPIFDKRFKNVTRRDLNLKNFWVNAEKPSRRDPIPLTNKTFAETVETVKDAVVNIYTRRVEEREARFGISPNDLLPIKLPIISSLLDIIPFQVPIPYMTEGVSLGSGFIINKEGYILTNAHVIHNATDIRVVLSEKNRDYSAKIIGIDRLTDTALIKIDPDGELAYLPLGDSDELQVGEVVIAIGNPLGLTHSVSSGMVSAKERIVPKLQDQALDFIQTDSAINPGSSGGPLLNMYGEAVGINTALLTEAQLIGFAIPIGIVKEVMPLLVLGKTERGWFGVSGRPLLPKDAVELNFPEKEGILITEVEKGSPAEKNGLLEKDVIVRFNGQPVKNFLTFRRKLLSLLPGQRVHLSVYRQGKTLSFTNRLVRRPPQ
ncbi:MAG: trypsin-like peptidase domain-containing protein [Nitrospinae bacterium]|nr:trypsin-like peptidase domain-containing protein [Nitrospinota bacterium]